MSKYTTDQILKSKVLYDDKNVKIREKCVTLKTYYFPICTSRRIPIDEITDIQFVDQGGSIGRIWGLTLANSDPCWLPCDSNRLGQSEMIVIHTSDYMKPAFTCCDNKKAYNLIKQLIQKNKMESTSEEMVLKKQG